MTQTTKQTQCEPEVNTMSAAKHTPGPWTVEQGSEHSHNIVTEDGMGAITAYLPYWYVATEEQQANATLIASAPDLLAALEGLMARYGHFSNGEIKQAANAIAKAKGGA